MFILLGGRCAVGNRFFENHKLHKLSKILVNFEFIRNFEAERIAKATRYTVKSIHVLGPI